MAAFVQCNSETEHALRKKVDTLIRLVDECRWIVDAYVSDFYTKDYWSRLPSAVQNHFDDLEPPDLAWMLAAQESEQQRPGLRVVPLSLLALQCCIQVHSLKRIASDLDSADTRTYIISALRCEGKSSKAADPCVSIKSFEPPNYKNAQFMDMYHIFRKHVKPKKQYEIKNLGQTIDMLSGAAQCKQVVDVGAGLGHLSRLLNFHHGLKVTTVEAASDHTPKAVTYDREMKREILKKRKIAETSAQTSCDSRPQGQTSKLAGPSPESYDGVVLNSKQAVKEKGLWPGSAAVEEEGLPSHLVYTIQPNTDASHFMDILKNTPQDTESIPEATTSPFLLAGLHACGDLTPTLLRVFVQCPQAVGLASVACCYMKISTACGQSDNSTNSGTECVNYPMSTYVKATWQSKHHLSYEAREMACHFADSYKERLMSNHQHLRVHSYRAALQYLLEHVKSDFKSGQARFVSKKGVPETFSQYVEENVKKVDIDLKTIPPNLIDLCEAMTNHWKRVVAFYTIRLSLAPAVETLLLLDRMLFLLEHGIPSVLVPIFDSSISPRNFALLALKSTPS